MEEAILALSKVAALANDVLTLNMRSTRFPMGDRDCTYVVSRKVAK